MAQTTPYRVGAPPTGGFGLPPEVAAWQERAKLAERGRQPQEAIWQLCQAFIANRQWVGWSKRDRRIINEPNPNNRERHTVNVLTQYLMTNVGKFMSDDMLPRLVMRNDSREGEEFAEQANRAMEYCWYEELEAEDKLYEAILKMGLYGIAGVQARWDGSNGPTIAKNVPYIDGKAELDPAKARQAVADNYGGERKIDFRDVRGRCSWGVLSPFNILPPPGVEHERDFPWLVIERPASLESLRNLYGEKAANLKEESLQSADGQSGLYNEGDSNSSAASNGGRLKNHVMLRTGYEMPTREFPHGQKFVWAGDKEMERETKLPYNIDGQPLVGIRFFKYHRIPGRFWPLGMVEPGIGPQRQRNRSRSQYIEIKDRAGLGRVWARPNSLKVAQVPGAKLMEVIEVRQGAEIPTESSGTGPGAWIAQDVQMHDADLDKVMGMGQASMGQAPGGVSAYSAMALLAEQDDKRVGPILKQIREEIKWLTKYTLNDIRTYWPQNKQIILAGEAEDAIDAFIFNSAQLPEDIYVRVGSGPPVPRSQAAEIQKIFDLYDRSVSSGTPLGVLWLQESLDAGKALPVPQTDQTVQTEKAEIENLLIARGGAVQVSSLDNASIHIPIHTEAVEQHALIPGAADVVRALQEHIQEHEQMQQSANVPGATAPGLQGAAGAQGGAMPGAPTAPTAQDDITNVNAMSPRPGSVDVGQAPGRFGRY